MSEDVLGNNPKPAPEILQELNPLELVVEGTRNALVLLLLGERVAPDTPRRRQDAALLRALSLLIA